MKTGRLNTYNNVKLIVYLIIVKKIKSLFVTLLKLLNSTYKNCLQFGSFEK